MVSCAIWGLERFFWLKLGVCFMVCNGLEVEYDSLNLVNLLHKENAELHPLGTLILNCKHLMEQFATIQVSHIHRERHMLVDILAKRCVNFSKHLHSSKTPVFASEVFLYDIIGVVHPRKTTSHMSLFSLFFSVWAFGS
ncbi:uncharacterized protein LOC112165811 [Rosa chinensis]|uniref:uncharacterized protein LOC112165811 n=1 Tax=Rosa chinensis TaxID=74649 RepID=UPI000D08BDCF|nr:uncharacterized protein LOC112165811 [Rosa chinensis]